MLAGNLSNQDEDEVEDELESLQREVEGLTELPSAPTSALPVETEQEQYRREKERARARATAQAAVPMTA